MTYNKIRDLFKYIEDVKYFLASKNKISNFNLLNYKTVYKLFLSFNYFLEILKTPYLEIKLVFYHHIFLLYIYIFKSSTYRKIGTEIVKTILKISKRILF